MADEVDEQPELPKLTDKQRLFVASYLLHFNKTRAALEAGYSVRCAHKYGYETYNKPAVKAAIEAEIESRCMAKNEVLDRLGAMARGDVGEFLTPAVNGGVTFDYEKARNKTALIKKLKVKNRAIIGDGDDPSVIETDVDFELYSALDALVQIGRHLGIFTDKTELSTPDGKSLRVEYVNDWRGTNETEN